MTNKNVVGDPCKRRQRSPVGLQELLCLGIARSYFRPFVRPRPALQACGRYLLGMVNIDLLLLPPPRGPVATPKHALHASHNYDIVPQPRMLL
jgi:hypothetical protein